MAEFQPVPIGRPPPRSWLPALGSTLAIILAVAIVKPWPALGPGDVAVQPASASAPAPARTAAPQRERDIYDPRLFGNYEPGPAWELWPAGYVVEFGIAGPVDVHAQHSAAPSGGATASAEPGSPSPTTSPPPQAATPAPPPPGIEHVVDLGASDHLIALGVNTPADVRVTEITLWMLAGAACCDQAIPTIRLPTLWESAHFHVIGIADPARPGEAGPWLAGEYRLDLELAGGQVRSVRLRVTPPVT